MPKKNDDEIALKDRFEQLVQEYKHLIRYAWKEIALHPLSRKIQGDNPNDFARSLLRKFGFDAFWILLAATKGSKRGVIRDRRLYVEIRRDRTLESMRKLGVSLYELDEVLRQCP